MSQSVAEPACRAAPRRRRRRHGAPPQAPRYHLPVLAPVFDLWSEAPYPGVGIVGVDVGERVIVAAASASEMGWDVDLATIADPLLARITSWIAADGDLAALAGRIRAFLAAIAKCAPERFPDGYPQVEALVAVAERDAVRVWSIGGGLVQHVRDGLVISENRPDWLAHSRDDVVVPMPFAVICDHWASPEGVKPQLVHWRVQAGDAVVMVNGEGIRRAGWYPSPTHWPGPLTAAGVGMALRAHYPGIRPPGILSEPPPFAGAAAVLRW